MWGHVASSPYKRESSVERQFRGDFTLHDVRPSDRNTYITLYRARGHASSTDNTTTSSSATIRNDGKPHHHITIEHAPRTRRKLPAASSYDDWHGDDAETSREGGGTTSNTGITSSIGSLHKQWRRPRALRRHAASRGTPPRSSTTAQARPSPSTRPSRETQAAALADNHQQWRAGPGRLHTLWPATPGRHGHPHHPCPREGRDWGSLARPWLARKPRGPLARRKRARKLSNLTSSHPPLRLRRASHVRQFGSTSHTCFARGRVSTYSLRATELSYVRIT